MWVKVAKTVKANIIPKEIVGGEFNNSNEKVGFLSVFRSSKVEIRLRK